MNLSDHEFKKRVLVIGSLCAVFACCSLMADIADIATQRKTFQENMIVLSNNEVMPAMDDFPFVRRGTISVDYLKENYNPLARWIIEAVGGSADTDISLGTLPAFTPGYGDHTQQIVTGAEAKREFAKAFTQLKKTAANKGILSTDHGQLSIRLLSRPFS